jgi:two-component system, LytTR family, sensor kinase
MKKDKKITFWIGYYAVILLVSVVLAAVTKYIKTGKVVVPETILVASIIFLIAASVGHLTMYFVYWSGKLSHSELTKKIVPAFAIYIATVLVIADAVVSLGVFVWDILIWRNMDLKHFLSQLLMYELSYSTKSLFVWLLFFAIAFFYILWKKSSQKELALREENLKFRYQTLKSQVNPHFLFNSLNTLSELIYSDVKHADNFLQQLSEVYRYILENEEKDLIPLENEIHFVQQFFNLQKERDNGKILLSINIEDTNKLKVIPVSLQLMVENALKHNLYSHATPLKIDISYNDGYVIVENNIQRKNVLGNSTKKGLSNLSERVKLILGKELIISEVDNKFIVKLPVIFQAE